MKRNFLNKVGYYTPYNFSIIIITWVYFMVFDLLCCVTNEQVSFFLSLFFQGLSFQQKIPEIEKSLQLVQFLKQKQSETLFKEEESDEDVDSTDKLDDDDENKELITRYELADTIYAKAELCIDQGIVHLWLGANVMLEYTYDGAIELLVDKLKIAKKQLQETTRDLAFTRNQIITSEVNISRIYNWDIRNKRQK